MKETWRWFGPGDAIGLGDVRQTGATGIVTALYDIAPGNVWGPDAIAERKTMIEAAHMTWDVVESLPVSEAIRTAGADRDLHIANWITSLEHLAQQGLTVICYNFMPILDWTRTNLAYERPSGARALRFDLVDVALFDIHVLARRNARDDYTPAVVAAADSRAKTATPADHTALTETILAGLPGTVEHWTLETFRTHISAYRDLGKEALRDNLAYFLERVVPYAEKLGLSLCCHPDDPPWPILGLPRIMSTQADYQWLVDVVPSPANGITFCTGSLGARGDNDLPAMMERLGQHVHFIHLRNVRRESEDVPCSFFEDDHLDGSTDMVAVIAAIAAEERRRSAAGRADASIPMRPDHGQCIVDDHHRNTAPGYPLIGRLKGLAELRGVYRAVEQSL